MAFLLEEFILVCNKTTRVRETRHSEQFLIHNIGCVSHRKQMNIPLVSFNQNRFRSKGVFFNRHEDGLRIEVRSGLTMDLPRSRLK